MEQAYAGLTAKMGMEIWEKSSTLSGSRSNLAGIT